VRLDFVLLDKGAGLLIEQGRTEEKLQTAHSGSKVRLEWLFATSWRAAEQVVNRESTAAEALARHAERAPLSAPARHHSCACSPSPCRKCAAASRACH
jgi:hypothetical protein